MAVQIYDIQFPFTLIFFVCSSTLLRFLTWSLHVAYIHLYHKIHSHTYTYINLHNTGNLVLSLGPFHAAFECYFSHLLKAQKLPMGLGLATKLVSNPESIVISLCLDFGAGQRGSDKSRLDCIVVQSIKYLILKALLFI